MTTTQESITAPLFEQQKRILRKLNAEFGVTTAVPLAVLFAATMETIGQLVDDGVRPPKTITTASEVEVLVMLHPSDVAAWVTALALPAPEWDLRESEDGRWIYRSASWSEADQADLPFHLTASDRVPVLDADLCSPACWQTDLGITG